MCGLAGFAGPLRIDAAQLGEMCDAVAHRGPDAVGIHHEAGRIGLGFRRLSIIDLETGDQPLFSEDSRVAATCNGEIYNYRDLGEGLAARGHRLTSRSDAEVLSHLYEEHGPDFLAELEGMFAIALWDADRGQLLLARDRMGVKPLYWAEVEGGILYGSDPRAILASGLLRPEPDLHAIGEYMALQYVPPPASGLRGINKLAPGEALVHRDGEVRTWTWWQLEPSADAPAGPDEAVDRLDGLLAEATRSRLRSDVPLGAFLSGGIDSSLVVSYMAEELPEVRTFSIDFAVPGYGEGAHARRVAELYGTRHESFVVEPDIVPTVGAVVERLGEPFADSSAVPTFLLSQITRRHVTVSLSGDGGDEAFGGYERYRLAAGADRTGPLARPLARLGMRLVPDAGVGTRSARVRRGLEMLAAPPSLRYREMVSHFTPAAVAALASDPDGGLADGARHAWDVVLAVPPGVRGVNRYMRLDLTSYLPGDLLHKVDRMSMAHALEVRSPMLDHRVHEFAAGLPGRVKLRRGRLKWPLKQLALRRGLPPDLVHRRKQGFAIPIGQWFRGELRGWMTDVLTDPRSRERGYFDPAAVDALIAGHVSGRRDHTPRLWNLLMLELWHRSIVDTGA